MRNYSMKHLSKPIEFLRVVLSGCVLFLLGACNQPQVPATFTESAQSPRIYPDYLGVTIPVNMAPLHFQLMESADQVVTQFSSPSGKQMVFEGRQVKPSLQDWRELVESSVGKALQVEVYASTNNQWKRYKPFAIYVSPDSIDPWMSYRLISPSYVTFEELTINQRCLENYEERVIYNNMLCTSETDGQCINCHSYQRGNPNRMQFHARQHHGGTLLNFDGRLVKLNLKTDSTLSAGVYPAWHPRLPLIAYSTDNTMQAFHTRDLNKIEVFDSQSDLILYDIDRNEVSHIEHAVDEYEVFPFWSPDGQYLYYCSAHFELQDTVGAEIETMRRYKEVKYNVYRKSFDEKTKRFGERELVFDAVSLGLSATLPRISPDGRWLLLSVGEWGCFHIWHRDADLWLVDLKSGAARPFSEVNSPNVEAYHTWSSNGRWIVFSSRRYDGDFTRPFFAHVDRDGHATKPFELPADDPDYHRQLMKSYNIPELMTGPVTVSPQTFADVLKTEAKAVVFTGH